MGGAVGSGRHREWSRVVVAAGWAVLSALAVQYVHTFTVNAPYADEWEFVPVLLGAEPLLPALWTQHNEHRLPLTRLVYFLTFRQTQDFRTGSFLQVVVLAGLSLWLIRRVTCWRGRTEWTDLFFPLLLLHPGHWENWVMGYQIGFVLYTALALGLAVAILETPAELNWGRALGAGLLALLTAASGGFGLPLSMAAGLWLLYAAVRTARAGRRGVALAAAAFPVVLGLYLLAYFEDYKSPVDHPPWCTDPWRLLRVAAQVLAMAWGIAAAQLWLMAGAATVALALFLWLRLLQDEAMQPLRRWGAAAVLLGQLALALAIAVGRGGFGPDMGLWPRYSLLLAPLLGVCYLLAVHRRWLATALVLAAATAFPANMLHGLHRGAQVLAQQQELARDAAAGWPAQQLIDRHFPASFNAGQEQRAHLAIPLLRRAGIGIFRPPASSATVLEPPPQEPSP